jgi:hypothetical protein
MKVLFNYDTEPFVPGPNDANVTSAIFDNWTNMAPGQNSGSRFSTILTRVLVGNGVLDIPDHDLYEHLSKPIIPTHESDIGSHMYSTSWVHQLHCLVGSLIMPKFWPVSNNSEVLFDEGIPSCIAPRT